MGTARAKVNLFLHVLGKRADGYHALQSLVVFADAGDAIEVAGAPAPALAVDGPFAPALAEEAAADNLILRAESALARLYAEERGAPPPPVEFRLRKELPVAAGIGGGSADAAEALRLLMAFWAFDPGAEKMEALALTLGADVPVAFRERPALMEGVGERLSPVTGCPAFPALLVNPGVPVPTGPVFKALNAPPLEGAGPKAPDLPERPDRAAWTAALGATRNDLEAPACRLHPEIADCLADLRALPGVRLARMSGSGGTCFALFETAAETEDAARKLAAVHPAWWIVPTRFAGS